jgi:hypothetical protein
VTDGGGHVTLIIAGRSVMYNLAAEVAAAPTRRASQPASDPQPSPQRCACGSGRLLLLPSHTHPPASAAAAVVAALCCDDVVVGISPLHHHLHLSLLDGPLPAFTTQLLHAGRQPCVCGGGGDGGGGGQAGTGVAAWVLQGCCCLCVRCCRRLLVGGCAPGGDSCCMVWWRSCERHMCLVQRTQPHPPTDITALRQHRCHTGAANAGPAHVSLRPGHPSSGSLQC